MAVEPPEIPRHVFSLMSNGQVTIPKELREQFETDEFAIFERDEQIILHPVRTK